MDIYDLIRYTIYGIIAGAPVLAGIIIARLRRGESLLAELERREFVTLKILVPRNNEKGPLSSEQMFAALHGIFREHLPAQEHVSFEVAADSQSIQFFAFLPRHLKDFVESQIYAQYPRVEIIEVPDYTYEVDITPETQVAGTELKLLKDEFFPIKTFPNFEVDPLAGITGVLSTLIPGERIWMQFMLEPATESWQKAGVEYVKAIKKGLNPKAGLNLSLSMIPKALVGFGGEVVTQIVHGPPKPEEKKPTAPTLSGPEEQAVKGIETKVTKLGFKTLIRVVALAPDAAMAKSKIMNVVGAFKQFNLSNLNGFAADAITVDRSIFDAFRRRTMREGYVLNTEELASVFHLPHVVVETPTIAWAGSKKGEPPQNLPIEGTVDPNEITLFAETNFRHLNQRFGVKLADRRYHIYSIGKTGTGKSTLIENMALDDIYKGRGVAVVDPHGDLIKRILHRIPGHRINDVVYFNPADRAHPVAFNLLENVEQDLKSLIASGLMSIFTKIWANVWSARMEYILRNTVLAALDYPDSTLLSIMKILNDPIYRKHVVAKIKDPVIRDFFINEFEKYDPNFRREAIAPIQNKVGQFLSSATIRNIVGQPHSTINFEEIINTGKILLVNLSIGEIGEDSSALLGGMVITKIQLASMRRANIPEEERKDFYLYVDEFQNFATDSFAVILSEARKYRLNLFLTNQYIAQMPETVKNAIFGNIGTIISFRVGPQDAGILAKEFEPVFEPNDLVNLSNWHIYLKMTIDGVTSVPFSAVTLAPTAEITGNAEKIIRVSQERYSRNREFVEKKITEWTEFWEKIAREEERQEKERRRTARATSSYIREAPSVRREEKPEVRAEERPIRPSAPPKKEEPKTPPTHRYIPPPPIRRSEIPKVIEEEFRKEGIVKPQEEEKPKQAPAEEAIVHFSPKVEEAPYVEPVEPRPLIQPHEVPEHHKKDDQDKKIPAYGSRLGQIVPLKEGEEIRLDE